MKDSLYNQFHAFEKEFNLFELKDKSGIYIWDALRYSVYTQISQGRKFLKFSPPCSLFKKSYLYAVALLKFFLYLSLHRNRRIMFIVNPRDKIGSQLIDKILDKPIDTVGIDKCLVIDSSGENYFKKNNKYKGSSILKIDDWFRKIFIHKSMNLDNLLLLLHKKWPSVKFSESELQTYYRSFLSQYYFYSFVFSFTRIRKVFFVQNGIMKGIYKAAKEHGIELVEFQHGEFSLAHPSYSYPTFLSGADKRIYLPNRLLSFGKYWEKNMYLPGCKVSVVGNAIYSCESYSEEHFPHKQNKNSILVVSNMLHGEKLSRIIKQVLDVKKNAFVFFKLHPNEFGNKQIYQKIFSKYANVQVVSDEFSIQDLLPEVDYVLVVQSTVEFEALSQGKKVLVLKILDYRELECLFGEEGVYCVNSVSEILDTMKSQEFVSLPKRTDFFQSYDGKIIKEILND